MVDSKRSALVVSGGGAKGAFSVGAIEVLRGRGYDYDLIAGTSTGALISPLAAIDDLDELVRQYTTASQSDVVQLNWRRGFLDALYDTRPLEQRIERSLFDEPFGSFSCRYDALMHSHRQIFICTVNLQRGGAEYFSQRALPPRVEAFFGKAGLVAAMLASSHEPLFMPPVELPPKNDQHLDGGLREIAPLNIVLQAGVGRVFAVVSSPAQPGAHSERYTNLMTIGLRAIDLMTDEIVLNDVQRAVRYNAALAYVAQLRQRVKTRFDLSEAELGELFSDDEQHFFADKHPVELVIIRPEAELVANSLHFDIDQMKRMRELGQVAANRALDAFEARPPTA